MNKSVVVVGGGLAGLSCAYHLHKTGIECLLLEASQQIGGRVQTDCIEGFLCDRGFQVLLTAYPETESVLDYEKLQLARFEPGALVRFRGKFHRFVDPLRRPRHLLSTAFSPIATLRDKFRVLKLRRDVGQGSVSDLYQRPEQTTIAHLRAKGFSEVIIESFFRPFLGGVFLESELNTSSRKFDFVFRMFAGGDAALPNRGMGELAKQLASRLPADSIRTNAPVEKVSPDGVRLVGGDDITAGAVVLAVDATEHERLLNRPNSTKWHGVTCLYFTTEKPPIDEPILVLNGEGSGPINNLCVPSQVCPQYAPAGQALISVSVLGVVPADQMAGQQGQVVEQLREWFGKQVDHWRHLKTYRIPHALPAQSPPALSPVVKSVRTGDGMVLCGDHLHTASINGAMVSGRLAAEQVLNDR